MSVLLTRGLIIRLPGLGKFISGNFIHRTLTYDWNPSVWFHPSGNKAVLKIEYLNRFVPGNCLFDCGNCLPSLSCLL